MTQQLILYPLLLQLLLAILLMFFWKKINTQRIISMLGSLVHLAVSIGVFAYIWNNGTQTVQAGSWEAPFGITFIADTFAITMVLLTSIAGLAVSIFSSGSVIGDRLRFGYFPIFHFLLLGLTGAFLTGDIFNLYVWFEIIIISSFVLITIGGEKAQLEGAVKYFTLNFLASMIFLTAIAVLYGLTGSLNMADLANKVAAVENRALVEITAILFLIGFGIKSAVFPLYFWLPASYHTPPSAVSAIFGGLLTKVGVYALIRVFTLIFVGDAFLDQILLVLAIFTLFSGALGALVQNNIRKVFSYLIICHIGYMIIGLGMFTEVAIAGAIFYLVHDILVKTNLFMISGLIYRIKGSNSMRALGGFYANYPKLSLLMFIPLFSLVGIPPLSGFWPKISLITASFETGSYWSLAAIIFASFITLVVIAKLWAEVFWKDAQEIPVKPKFRYYHKIKNIKRIQIVVPIVFLSMVTLYVGFGAEHIQTLATRISSELMNNQQYIDAVLNTQISE
ncbi:proton-conducting transporter transmembrane domain-containing protein [Salegentibacter salarius]|uniref:Cation:proton antiporter n=1 Tax=Salegentibacter salarius TaxID=435906 RepID=A0A2N0TV27_9FLAO|nr:proton-conducting transporter membrane subunit [Salegentibacter salarius]OEY72274.1 Na+/H+ antiporter subunit D [Salegentibacter salarius]PKD18595.1 cation:proton antiporter [Salegentibacter salarius]SLJ88458.1 multicomponent Na+:H+ antiporter subunit D [Salegentibacter salarius]